MTHPGADIIEEYVMGVRLGQDARHAMAIHFLHCQTCQEACAQARLYVDAVRALLFYFEPVRDSLSRN